MSEKSAGRRRLLGWASLLARVLLVAAAAVLVAVVGLAAVAWAQPTPPPGVPTAPGVTSIDQVLERMRLWLVGLMFAVAGFYGTVAAFRYAWSNGDPEEVQKAKNALRNAGIGVALAVLAPLLVTIVIGFVA